MKAVLADTAYYIALSQEYRMVAQDRLTFLKVVGKTPALW